LRGIEEVATNNGYFIQLMATQQQHPKERDILSFCRQWS
jgi:DNA-binding LacI/PurR family transcriptional regulator